MKNKNEQKTARNNLLKKVCFVAIIALLVLSMFGCALEDGSDTSSNNDSANSQTSTYGMNEKVVVKDLEFTVIDVADTKQLGSDLLGNKTENNFVIVTMTIKNNSSNEKYLTDSNFKYCRGNVEYDSNSGGIYLDNGFYATKKIGPGLSVTIEVAYEIPSEHQSTDCILAKDSYKSEKIYLKGAANSVPSQENNAPDGNDTTAEATPSSESAISYGINQSVAVKELEFTVKDVTDTKQVGSTYVGKKTDNNFVLVTMTVKNNSSSEIMIDDSNFKYYRGNNAYDADSAGAYVSDGFYVLETIGPGISKTFVIVYEIPSEHQTTDYILVKDSYKSEKIYLK